MRALPAVARLGSPTLAYLARKSALTSRQLVAAHLAALQVDYVRAHEPAIAVRAWELHAALAAGCGRPHPCRRRTMADLYLSLGSNLAPRRHLPRALALLRAPLPAAARVVLGS